MSDITGELERLADLRDKGVLTQEEFDQQKAILLRAPSMPAAPVGYGGATSEMPATTTGPIGAAHPGPYAPNRISSASADKTPLFIALGIVALAILGLALWATGVVKLPGSGNGVGMAGTGFPASNFNSSIPVVTPTAITPPVATIPTDTASAVPATADDSWLVGQWENVATPSCAQWLRFNADHSVGDNADSSGTWSIAAGDAGNYTITMNITGSGVSQGPMSYDAAAGTITMGGGSNTVTWRKASC